MRSGFILLQTLHRDIKRGWYYARSARRLRIRGFAGMRPRGTVWPRERATAAAADADVRPHQRNFRDRRRVWQGPDRGRTRRQSGPLVLRLPFQGRSGHAGMPGSRCALADGRLLSGLERRRGTRSGAGARRAEAFRSGDAERSQDCVQHRHQTRDAFKARAGNRRRVAFGRRRDYLSGEGFEGRAVQAGIRTAAGSVGDRLRPRRRVGFEKNRQTKSGRQTKLAVTQKRYAKTKSQGEAIMRRVVITGMGIVSSIGNNTQEVLASLHEAKSGITRAEKYAELGFRSQVQGAPTLNPADVIDRRAMRFLGEGAAWNHIAMEQAIQDSGLQPSDVSNERTGIIMGSGGPSARTIVEAADTTRTKGPKRVGPFAVPKAMSSTASATLATWFKIKGVNYSISSACATSNHCIGNAFETIQVGKQDMIFAGGCEELDWTLSVLFDAMGAMSSGFNQTPDKASRAYDADRDGFIIAGGAGVLVLEEIEHAKARGARIYGEIVGYGATSDGYDMVAPSGEGAERCMRMAMSTVNTKIDYINPHATSTPAGDPPEIEAIRKVFGTGEKCPPIAAPMALLVPEIGGHFSQEAIYSLLMMNNGFICESAHITELDPVFSDMPIVRKRIDNAKLGTVLSNSFGFGGTNATLVFKRMDA